MPVAIGTLTSPEWTACRGSSTKTAARRRIAGSSSCLPGASAPMALMCVPSRIHALITSGAREGVVVTRRSQSAVRSSESARISKRENFRAKASAVAGRRLQTRTRSIPSQAAVASSWVSACRPAPTSPSSTPSCFRQRCRAATAPAAPVRRSVSPVAFRTAYGIPVGGSSRTISAITVSRPRAGLPGWTFTILTPASPRAGM